MIKIHAAYGLAFFGSEIIRKILTFPIIVYFASNHEFVENVPETPNER